MSDTEADGVAKQTREVSVVPVPAAVFRQILDQLAGQPYRDVGALMNLITTYKSQNVCVTSSE